MTNHDFIIHLKFLYKRLTPTQTFTNTWPPSATHKFFNLAMIKSLQVRRVQIDDQFVRMTITGKVDDILQEKCPVHLQDIFCETEGKPKVVLLEGAPGCGKSALSVHISQQWGEGKLFTGFKYVILVQLRDPAVQAASCIADLLPARDSEMRQQAAEDIVTDDGEGVLFILDGWDNLPYSCRINSIFCDMIGTKKNPLLKSSVIVTSRPIASGDLHYYASTRIEIVGFTPEELGLYFTDCLNGDGNAVEILFERIHENPAIASSCYLPMNASILVHLFINDNNTLPTTLYGIFSELILSCIYRHLSEHTEFNNLTLESLQQIPEAIKKPFLSLCDLAYKGIIEDKVIFSLPADVKTLGLLQGVESFVRQEKTLSYNFLHLSIQEIMAGFYMAKQLPDNEQVSKFSELFDKSRFSAVFQFYAAITKLQTPGIKNAVVRVAKRSNKTLLVSLLHCLYEAQDASICEYVAQHLRNGLDLSHITLTPSDCLCIGYFLSNICKMAIGKFNVSLNDCKIGDQGCKYLVRCLDILLPVGVHNAEITMNLHNNAITHRGVDHLSIAGCIKELRLGPEGNFHSLSILSYKFNNNELGSLQGTFVEQLKSNHTLKSLYLNSCGLTSLSAKSLAEALTTNKHLKELDISGNTMLGDDGIQHLALALRVNQSLKELDLQECGITYLSESFAGALTTNKYLEELNISFNELGDDGIPNLAHALQVNQQLQLLLLTNCGITDTGLQCLAKAIQDNHSLRILAIHNMYSKTKNTITENIIPVLIECLQNNDTLTALYLPTNLKSSSISSINEAVNEVRKGDGLPLIEVKVM